MHSLLNIPQVRAALPMLTAVMLWTTVQPVAHAIPSGQRDFDADTVSTDSTSLVLVPNTSVTVNNDLAHHCVIEFSAEVGVTVGGQSEVGYTIDSADPAACITQGGPSLLDTPSVGTHTVRWVKAIGRGLHKIRVCYRWAGDVPGGTTSLQARSLTVECRTQ
jgi:hypothetical protein